MEDENFRDIKSCLRSSQTLMESLVLSMISGLLKRNLSPMLTIYEKTAWKPYSCQNGKGPSIMLAAHMDEIGLMVRYIDDNGFRFIDWGMV